MRILLFVCCAIVSVNSYADEYDWSPPEITDNRGMVYSQTSELRGTGTMLAYACATDSDWCGPALSVTRPCTIGVQTPALATITGGGLESEYEGTVFVFLTCIFSDTDGSLVRFEDEDEDIAAKMLLGEHFSVAYPTSDERDHGYAAERFSLHGSIQAMKAVFDMASAINPRRSSPNASKGDF